MLSCCRSSFHLPYHRHSHVMDVVVFRKIEVFGHGDPTPLVAGVLFETLH